MQGTRGQSRPGELRPRQAREPQPVLCAYNDGGTRPPHRGKLSHSSAAKNRKKEKKKQSLRRTGRFCKAKYVFTSDSTTSRYRPKRHKARVCTDTGAQTVTDALFLNKPKLETRGRHIQNVTQPLSGLLAATRTNY